MLSTEQRTFVEDPILVNGKLFAPPGSGKSTCVIHRHIFLVRTRICKPNETLIVTFTRNSSLDLQDRIRHTSDLALFERSPNGTVNNVRTIDSLGWHVMQRWNKSNLSKKNYSTWLLQFLNHATPEQLRQTNVLRNVRVLFVDEAQDLNQTQFDVIVRLQQLLNLVVYLVGDPNQGIYGFRGSSPCYMIDFPGKEYILTQNFRSTQAIVNFTEPIKPHPQYTSVATTLGGTQPHVMHTPFTEFTTFFVNFVKSYSLDLCNIAILCPTRGRCGKFGGLARVANMLDELHIPFVQMYHESVDSDDVIEFKSTSGHVNLLTYHGSKGKEWHTVICTDLWVELMNQTPTQHEHADHQYLLYVVLTRARNELIIHIDRDRTPNPWLNNIPTMLYEGFIYSKPFYAYAVPRTDTTHLGVREVVKNMTNNSFAEIENHITYTSQTRPQHADYTRLVRGIVKNDFVLFGCFLENLFSVQCSILNQTRPRPFPVIEAILAQSPVVLHGKILTDVQSIWRNHISWDHYDRNKNGLSTRLLLLVKRYFRRDVSWENHFFTDNQFYNIVQDNMNDIRRCYDEYLSSVSDYTQKLRSVFYLTLVTSCYENNHLFHIKNFGRGKQHLLDPALMDLFEDMNRYAKYVVSMPYQEQTMVKVPYLHITGRLDIRFMNGTIMETKACQQLLSIQNTFQVMLYALADSKSYTEFISKQVILYNFISGEVATLRFTISESSMASIFRILSQASSQPLRGMRLVGHMEYFEKSPLFLSLKDDRYDFYILKDQFIRPSDHNICIDAKLILGDVLTELETHTTISVDECRSIVRPFIHQMSQNSVIWMTSNTHNKKKLLVDLDFIDENNHVMDVHIAADIHRPDYETMLRSCWFVDMTEKIRRVLRALETDPWFVARWGSGKISPT